MMVMITWNCVEKGFVQLLSRMISTHDGLSTHLIGTTSTFKLNQLMALIPRACLKFAYMVKNAFAQLYFPPLMGSTNCMANLWHWLVMPSHSMDTDSRRANVNKHMHRYVLVLYATAYQLGNTSSRTITEVKQLCARLVLGWETVQVLPECCC